ncbi:unnamed protein product [Heterosigma akashiwo]
MMCDAFARSILDNTFPALETVKSLDVKAWSESEQMLFLSSLNRVIEANDIDILLHKRICGVLKQLVSEIESTGQDVLNEVYEALAEFQFSNPCTYYQPEKNIAEDMTIARYPVPDMPGSAISIKQNIWHSEVPLPCLCFTNEGAGSERCWRCKSNPLKGRRRGGTGAHKASKREGKKKRAPFTCPLRPFLQKKYPTAEPSSWLKFRAAGQAASTNFKQPDKQPAQNSNSRPFFFVFYFPPFN